jgi:diacylglycerol kinase family enzyme
VPKMVHADARLFGDTPVEFKVIPNALKVITGFPEKHTSSFNKRTYLDL